MTIEQAFAVALQHHQAGRLAQAEATYRQILAVQPAHADSLNLLGVIAHSTGHSDQAIELTRRAIAVAPATAMFHFNLGVALFDTKQIAEAIAAYQRAVELQPNYAEALSNLGHALKQERQFERAAAACERAVQLRPEFVEALNNLGNALAALSRFEEAIQFYRRALRLRPGQAEIYNNLGSALRQTGHLDEAIAACERALQLQAGYAEAHSNVATALDERGRLDEAIAHYERSIALQPGTATAHNNLGNALKNAGRLDEAVGCYRRAMALAPGEPVMHSNLIYSLHFHAGHDAASIAEEHAQWDRQFAEPLRLFQRPHDNTRDPEQRLRIGYVSPDFRRHVICHFLVPLLEKHDHERFEIHCYASVKRPDRVTERLRKCADEWKDVLNTPDDAVAEMVRADGIDVLVDLTQHMSDNRLPVFARKPAPVQVAWLGYPGTIGLREIDYRFTDTHLEPEGAPWAESVETPVRLPDSWFCFEPLDEYPLPGELPALRTGHVTFACLNNFCKVATPALERWAAVLRAVGDSRLLLRCPAGETQTRVREFFRARGVAPERIEMLGWLKSREEFLHLFERIDLALDPFPYNGGTTTCEALWMGVPVLTSPAPRVVSRIGLSILSAAGMPGFVAESEADEIALAARLAHDLPRLAELRATLRERMRASPFMDAPRFARNVEHAYREMWRAWCGRPMRS